MLRCRCWNATSLERKPASLLIEFGFVCVKPHRLATSIVGLFLRFRYQLKVAFEVLRRASGPLLAMLAVGLFLRSLHPREVQFEVLREALRTPLDDVSRWLRLGNFECVRESFNWQAAPIGAATTQSSIASTGSQPHSLLWSKIVLLARVFPR